MSSFALKILACALMVLDHIGFAFFPKIEILRTIGRLAFPIFLKQATWICGLFTIRSGIANPTNDDLQLPLPPGKT